MSAANTAVPAASAASSRRTSAGAPSAITMAAGWTAKSLPSIPKSSLSWNAARCAISWLPRTWTRLGWMRLRWPTSAAASVLSRRSRVAPPAFPPSQASPSLSRLSSYSCATLICNMGLPGGDVLMERARIGVGRQLSAQFAVAQHLRELREDLKVLFGRLLGNQQHEHEIDGLAVGSVEGHGLSEPHKSPDRLFQALDPAVRNRDPLAQARRAEALPSEQAVEHQAPRHALIVLEEEPRLLEHALLARHVKVQKDVGRGQKLRNQVHRELWRIGRFPRAQQPCPEAGKAWNSTLSGNGKAFFCSPAPHPTSPGRGEPFFFDYCEGGWCLSASWGCACRRSLYLMLLRSSLSARASIAACRSGSPLSTNISLPATWQVTSAFWARGVALRTTFTSMT